MRLFRLLGKPTAALARFVVVAALLGSFIGSDTALAAEPSAAAKAAFEQFEISMAGALVVVCAEPEKAERYYGMRGERLYSTQNCAAAIQNMLLEAHSLGLGTRWIGAFDYSKQH